MLNVQTNLELIFKYHGVSKGMLNFMFWDFSRHFKEKYKI
jgi:hypothetical protein